MYLHALLVILLSHFAALTTSLPTPDPCADDTTTTTTTSLPTPDPCAEDTTTTTSLPTSTPPSPLPPTNNPFGRPILSPPILSLPPTPANLTRRETLILQPANIEIEAYFAPDCMGGYITITPSYSVAYLNKDPFQSYMLSRRMRAGEQLDFSGPPGCEDFLEWEGGLGAGVCRRLGRPVGCLRLWHY